MGGEFGDAAAFLPTAILLHGLKECGVVRNEARAPDCRRPPAGSEPWLMPSLIGIGLGWLEEAPMTARS